jgi:hypothetical protein
MIWQLSRRESKGNSGEHYIRDLAFNGRWAVREYDKWAAKIYGDVAILNFPELIRNHGCYRKARESEFCFF